MDHAIVSRETIRNKARRAFVLGHGRDDHHMNPLSPAVADWQAEWDLCAAAYAQQRAFASRQGMGTPP